MGSGGSSAVNKQKITDGIFWLTEKSAAKGQQRSDKKIDSKVSM